MIRYYYRETDGFPYDPFPLKGKVKGGISEVKKNII